MSKDKLFNKFKPNVYMKPDEYLNGWARKCGWKASLVYDSLWRHADKYGHCFPSIELMALEHGVHPKTIEKGLRVLVEFNLVSRKQIKDSKTGKFRHNNYTLLDKSEWKDPYPLGVRTVHRTPSQSKTVPPHSTTKGTHMKDTHIISKPVVEKNKNNVENSHSGMQSISSLVARKKLALRGKNGEKQVGGAAYPWQDQAVRIAGKLGISPSPSWFRFFRNGHPALLEAAFRAIADVPANDPERYFYKVYRLKEGSPA